MRFYGVEQALNVAADVARGLLKESADAFLAAADGSTGDVLAVEVHVAAIKRANVAVELGPVIVVS